MHLYGVRHSPYARLPSLFEANEAAIAPPAEGPSVQLPADSAKVAGRSLVCTPAGTVQRAAERPVTLHAVPELHGRGSRVSDSGVAIGGSGCSRAAAEPGCGGTATVQPLPAIAAVMPSPHTSAGDMLSGTTAVGGGEVALIPIAPLAAGGCWQGAGDFLDGPASYNMGQFLDMGGQELETELFSSMAAGFEPAQIASPGADWPGRLLRRPKANGAGHDHAGDGDIVVLDLRSWLKDAPVPLRLNDSHDGNGSGPYHLPWAKPGAAFQEAVYPPADRAAAAAAAAADEEENGAVGASRCFVSSAADAVGGLYTYSRNSWGPELRRCSGVLPQNGLLTLMRTAAPHELPTRLCNARASGLAPPLSASVCTFASDPVGGPRSLPPRAEDVAAAAAAAAAPASFCAADDEVAAPGQQDGQSALPSGASSLIEAHTESFMAVGAAVGPVSDTAVAGPVQSVAAVPVHTAPAPGIGTDDGSPGAQPVDASLAADGGPTSADASFSRATGCPQAVSAVAVRRGCGQASASDGDRCTQDLSPPEALGSHVVHSEGSLQTCGLARSQGVSAASQPANINVATVPYGLDLSYILDVVDGADSSPTRAASASTEDLDRLSPKEAAAMLSATSGATQYSSAGNVLITGAVTTANGINDTAFGLPYASCLEAASQSPLTATPRAADTLAAAAAAAPAAQEAGLAPGVAEADAPVCLDPAATCDMGTLQTALSAGWFVRRPGTATSGGCTTPAPDAAGAAAEGASNGDDPDTDWEAVLLTLLEVAEALQRLHASGLVHRALCPDAIQLRAAAPAAPAPAAHDRRGFAARLADFGLAAPYVCSSARAYARRHARQRRQQAVLTAATGPLLCIPPEGHAGAPPDPSWDMYSYGLLMWSCTNGARRPYDKYSNCAVRCLVLHGVRPAFGAHVPVAYRDLAESCWSHNAAVRPSALEVASRLRALLREAW